MYSAGLFYSVRPVTLPHKRGPPVKPPPSCRSVFQIRRATSSHLRNVSAFGCSRFHYVRTTARSTAFGIHICANQADSETGAVCSFLTWSGVLYPYRPTILSRLYVSLNSYRGNLNCLTVSKCLTQSRFS